VVGRIGNPAYPTRPTKRDDPLDRQETLMARSNNPASNVNGEIARIHQETGR